MMLPPAVELESSAIPQMVSPGLEIKTLGRKGRGVFATRTYAAGQLIERTPVIVVPEADWQQMETTILYNYVCAWDTDREAVAIILGYGSLYNHSYSPSAVYKKNFTEQYMDFVAFRDINAGEEITINYSGPPNSHNPVWFSVVDDT